MTDKPYSTGLPENLVVKNGQDETASFPLISIAGVEITTDSEGRFNLNALHKASKLGVDKAPAQWLRNKQAKQLVQELERETVQICIVSDEGRNGGTFAHELLAVSYAGWISPSFQLKVNQAFLDVRSGSMRISLPNFSDPVMAAHAWIEQYEARQLAVHTKAEISTRREATAMNTASQAVKKVSKLELELDRSQDYATVKRMEKLWHGIKFSWRELKSVATEMGIPPIDIFDANYGTVKAYHADVWREAYALEIPNIVDRDRSFTRDE